MLKPNTPIPCAKAVLAHPVQSLCYFAAKGFCSIATFVVSTRQPGQCSRQHLLCAMCLFAYHGTNSSTKSLVSAPRTRPPQLLLSPPPPRPPPLLPPSRWAPDSSSSAFLRCLPVGSRGKCDNVLMATDLFRFATSAIISHLARYVHQLLT